ncbi:hypothetical protein [Streptomyces sp. 3N207]|uniref:hypothetical protein n=1 Tax=Streptomyces sp. 3N207 TaxID=3457417 RepID=UPI003FD57A17
MGDHVCRHSVQVLVDRLDVPRRPAGDARRRRRDHPVPVGVDAGVVEHRLEQTALPLVEVPARGEEPVAEERPGPLEHQPLAECPGLPHQHPMDQRGGVQHVYRRTAQVVITASPWSRSDTT